MTERDICKQLIDLSFVAKAQLQSKETELLRSILSILIMEAEDVVETLDEMETLQRKPDRIRSVG